MFLFTLSVRPETSPCYPVSYRPGNCCNQAMDAVSLAMLPVAAAMVSYVRVYMYGGKELVPVVTLDGFGMRILLPYILTVNDIPPGEFYTFEIGFNAADYADTTQLPCKPSKFEPLLPACDYFVHGWQTDPYNSSALLPPDDLVAGCCPEGVVQFCSEQISGSCNPRLSDTPLRLGFTSSDEAGGKTMLHFMVSSSPVTHSLYNVTSPPLADCSAMDLAYIKLYVAPNIAQSYAVDFALDATNVQNFTSGVDSIGSYIQAYVPPGYTGLGDWTLELFGSFTKDQVCSYKAGLFSVCAYVLGNAAEDCCSLGDVAVVEAKLPVVKYG